MDEVRPIDANALLDEIRKSKDGHQHTEREILENHHMEHDVFMDLVDTAPTISPDSLRPKGRWVIKHRHRGGFRRYTGYDEFGKLHTIMVDERFEVDDPYCPYCGKFNESIHLNFYPNCGADMRCTGDD